MDATTGEFSTSSLSSYAQLGRLCTDAREFGIVKAQVSSTSGLSSFGSQDRYMEQKVSSRGSSLEIRMGRDASAVTILGYHHWEVLYTDEEEAREEMEKVVVDLQIPQHLAPVLAYN